MKPTKIRPEEVLEYHSSGRKGKIEVAITKPCSTQHDLSIAYSPGVAIPCLEIKKILKMSTNTLQKEILLEL